MGAAMTFNDVTFLIANMEEEHVVWGTVIVIVKGTPYRVKYNVDLISGIVSIDNLPESFHTLPDPDEAFKYLVNSVRNSVQNSHEIYCPLRSSKCTRHDIKHVHDATQA